MSVINTMTVSQMADDLLSDEELAEVYLIWQAAHEVVRELEESEV